jgi:CheY-like chemotaxis protein
MPIMDGDVMIRKCKDELELGNMKFIVVSGGVHEELIQNCRSMGLEYILEKPINKNIVREFMK